MTRIDFAFGAPDRLRMACEVVRKRYLAGQRLVVYCKDGSRLAAFDRMLWAFDDTAFVPHVLANDPLAADTPVVLTAGDPQQAAGRGPGRDPPPWLLNLDNDCPPGFGSLRAAIGNRLRRPRGTSRAPASAGGRPGRRPRRTATTS